jgi:hypothetical protein
VTSVTHQNAAQADGNGERIGGIGPSVDDRPTLNIEEHIGRPEVQPKQSLPGRQKRDKEQELPPALPTLLRGCHHLDLETVAPAHGIHQA